jgi:hypothetical protein
VGENCNLVAKAKIASTKDSADYRLAVLDAGHAPTYDFLYEIGFPDNRPVEEEDIAQDNHLRWFTPRDINSPANSIPPHIKDIVAYLTNNHNGHLSPRFWELDNAWLASRLDDLSS